jgi:chloramphenicol-sensitive protein RarD
MNSGVVYALLAYVIWGLFPIYFKALESIPALQILAHRMAWSLIVVALLLAVLRRWSWLRALRGNPWIVARFAASAILLSSNWGLYIWAVNSSHVVDASLGYYINPLVNVVLAAVLLHERLRAPQWVAVGIAAVGVVAMTFELGHLPWISLGLALTFGGYGLLRKTATLGSLEGLALETALLFPLALLYLYWLGTQGQNAFVAADAATRWLLVAAGPVTTIPLLLFAAGARRIPFSLLGVLQYVTPSLQLALGVLLYHEPFGAAKMVGFGLVWLGLLVFLADGLRAGLGRRG